MCGMCVSCVTGLWVSVVHEHLHICRGVCGGYLCSVHVWSGLWWWGVYDVCVHLWSTCVYLWVSLVCADRYVSVWDVCRLWVGVFVCAVGVFVCAVGVRSVLLEHVRNSKCVCPQQ